MKKPSQEGLVPPRIAICADSGNNPDLLEKSARLAEELGLPLLKKLPSSGYEMLLVVLADRLELRVLQGDAALRGGRGVSVELGALDTQSGAGRSFKQPIARAVGLRAKKDLPLTIIDATAGWGKDAWLLASLGCQVLAVERSPVVAALLQDSLGRAGRKQPEIQSRIRLLAGDSRTLLPKLPSTDPSGPAHLFSSPDVVFMDPMFPDALARKTAEKKPMRILRRLVGSDDDAKELFQQAMNIARRRVVVKQALKGGTDFGVKPVASHKGKGFRFDIYVPGIRKTK